MSGTRAITVSKHGERGQMRLAMVGALSAIIVAVAFGAGITRDAQADPASPLLVAKTADANPVASGAQLTYTVTIKNTGGAKLSNLVMTDQVNGVGVIQSPPALPQLQITSTQGTCSQGGPNGNVVTCNGGNLAGGATWTVTIRGQVTASNGTTLNNTASATGTKSAQTFSTSATVQVLVQGGTGGGAQPDLTINKTGPSSVAASSPMTYTLTVNNVGTAPATNVRVVDTVPVGVIGISATSPTSLFVCGVAGQTVTCDGGAVNTGANATITINATSPAVEGSITNTAVVDPNNTIAESNELNNTSATVYTSVGLPPSGPLLDIKKTDGAPFQGTWGNGAGPDPVTPGQQITYKIQVTNNAIGNNSRADDVIVTDGTQGLEASSIVVSQVIVNGTVGTFGGCVVTAPQVRCSIRSLNSGGTLTITITGTVVSSAGSTIFNTATVTGNVKNTGVTNTASEATTVKPAVDLTITKADSPDPVCARSWPIDGIAFPPGPATSQHLAVLDVGLGSDASGTPTELLAPPVCLGGLTYSFVVGNSGIATATGVVVRDPLPVGLIFDSYENDVLYDAGFVCAVDAANVITCSGGTIPPESITKLAFRLVAPPALGTITNTVYVDPNNAIFEPDETNNTFVQSTDIATGVDLVVWKSDSVQVDPPGDDLEGAPTLIPGSSTDLADGYDPIATSGTQTVTIYVDNVGTQDTTGIRLRDTLPAGTRFLSVMEVPGGSDLGPGLGTLHGFTCSHDGSPTGGIVECVGGNLLGTESEFYDPAGPVGPPPGDHFATIKIRFFARPEVGTMHNEVRVDPLNEIAEVNELNNLATDETLVTVGNADRGAYHQLAVVKTHESPAAGTVATNGTLIYNLDVTNYGTDPVSNIILVDTLPAGTRFIEAKDTDTGTDAFFCSHDGSIYGGVITCTGGDLDGSINQIPVGSDTRRVTVKVFAPDTPGTYNNVATVDPNNLVPEGNEFDNDAQLSTLVAPCVGQTNCTDTNAFYELTIAKAQFSPAPPIVVATNGVVTYDLLITNLGSDPVYGVVVKDTLPAGSRFIDAQDTGAALDPSAFSCGEPDATRTLTCVGGTLDGTLDTLGAGVPQVRTIRIRIFAPNTPATYPNQSKVDPANAVPEGNEFNNTSNITTPVEPCVSLAACTAANAFYELTIVKEQNRPAIARNGLETYTLTITNWGSDPVSDVVVEDALPAGARLLDAKDSAPPSDPAAFTCGEPNASNVLTCTGGDLSGTVVALAGIPVSRQIVIRAFMPDLPATYPNAATVDPSNAVPEGNEFNNQSSLLTVVSNGGPTPYIDLTVDKTNPAVLDQDTGGPDGIVRVTPGHLIMYVLTVSNTLGEGDAFNVTVRDSLPANATYHSALDTGAAPGQFSCGLVPGETHTLECTGGTVPAGGSRTINVFVTAPTNLDQTASDLENIQQLITNNALVDPANSIPEGDEANNADIVRTTVQSQINLTADKEGPDNAQQNQEDDYTITVKNNKVWGDGDIAVDAVVVDTLPVGLIPLTVTTSAANFLCSIEENPVNVVTCVGDLEPEQEVTITVHVFITQESGQMYNQACIDPDHQIDETNELDNCDVKTTNVGAPTPTPEPDVANLNINKSASSSVVEPGQNLTYTVSVSNTGTGTAADVTIRDDLSALPVTFVSANATNGFTCVEAAAVVTCTDGGAGLAAGTNTVVTIEVTVDADASAAFTNTAMVDDADPFVTAVDTASVTTNVGAAGIDLIVASYTDSPDPVPQGDSVTFTTVVTNGGTADTTTDPAPNTVVVQTLFDSNTGLSVASATASQGFACDTDLSDFTIECTGDLASGDSTTITIVLQTSGTSPASLSSIVTVDPADDILEASELNNFDSQVTTITGSICSTCIDLVLSGPLESATSVDVGDTLTYTITVGNIGDTSTDTGAGDQVLIFFDLQGSGGATFSAPVYSTTAGFGCSLFSGDADTALSDCTGELGPGQGTIITITVTATAAGTISATAEADPNDTIGEFLETNNGPSVQATIVNP